MDTVPGTSIDDSQSRGLKRTSNQLVDPDNIKNEVSSSKEPKIELDKIKKIKVLKFIARALYEVHILKFKDIDPHMENINLEIQIANIVFTAHNFLRQKNNELNGKPEEKVKSTVCHITITDEVYRIKREDTIKAVMSAAVYAGLSYKNYSQDNKDNWYGMAAPYLNLLICFGLRFTELRIGHSAMVIKRDKGGSTSFPVRKYGLDGSHHILLEGCTFSPEKRNSMAQSVGPMTALLCMIRSTNDYRKKWEDVVKRSMGHIHGINDFINISKEKTAKELKPLITIIADIVLITKSGQLTRLCFPANVFARIFNDQKLFGSQHTNVAYSDDADMMMGPSMIENFDTSGHGAFHTYKIMCRLKCILGGDFSESHVPQIVFHCMFGTHKEDLGVLSAITNHKNWCRRDEIGNGFRKMNKSKTVHKFYPIQMTCYSKMCSEIQTELSAIDYIQTASFPAVSDCKTQTNHEDFVEKVRRKTKVKTGWKTIKDLIVGLSTMVNELCKKLRTDSRRESGTVPWRDIRSLKKGVPGDVIPNMGVIETGEYFMRTRKYQC